jgi:sucrose-6-phosphate hydrolase SacC (GH32 family)
MATVVHRPDSAFPRFHARPGQGWISDPCGLRYANGRCHVFFQFNPDSARHSSICWGHLSSPDLVRWTGEPVALTPHPGGPDALGCWTGVMADDGGVSTAVYSGVASTDGRPRVVLARGSRDLATWSQDGVVPAEIWECPQLVRVPDSSGAETWLLMASLLLSGELHEHPNGVGYLLGSVGALAVDPAAELEAYRGTRLYANAAGTLPLPRHAEAHVTGGEGRIRLNLRSTPGNAPTRLAASTGRTVFTEEVAGGDDVRIFLDASVVEAYRRRSVPTTVRVYPEAGEVWQLELPHGASADAWGLRHPDPA